MSLVAVDAHPEVKTMKSTTSQRTIEVLHVQKLWTSMHNSTYDCDKKNLIAPLNSLGTLEIYHVIKTAN